MWHLFLETFSNFHKPSGNLLDARSKLCSNPWAAIRGCGGSNPPSRRFGWEPWPTLSRCWGVDMGVELGPGDFLFFRSSPPHFAKPLSPMVSAISHLYAWGMLHNPLGMRCVRARGASAEGSAQRCCGRRERRWA